MHPTIRLRLPARREAGRQARQALAELTLASSQLEDLLLLVSELVSGCVAGADQPEAEIELCVAVERRVVRARVAGRIASGFDATEHLPNGRRTLFDCLAQRWGLIEEGSGGAWVELHRDLAAEHTERRQALRERSAAIHERAAAMHMRAACFHRQLAEACRTRGQQARAEQEACRAQAAQHRCESELFRVRRALAPG